MEWEQICTILLGFPRILLRDVAASVSLIAQSKSLLVLQDLLSPQPGKSLCPSSLDYPAPAMPGCPCNQAPTDLGVVARVDHFYGDKVIGGVVGQELGSMPKKGDNALILVNISHLKIWFWNDQREYSEWFKIYASGAYRNVPHWFIVLQRGSIYRVIMYYKETSLYGPCMLYDPYCVWLIFEGLIALRVKKQVFFHGIIYGDTQSQN